MNPTKPRNNLVLVLLVIALFTTAGLVFSRAVDFAQFMQALTGSLTNAGRYRLDSERRAPAGTRLQSQNNAVAPAAITGTLTIVANPDRARFDILSAGTGVAAFANRTGAEPMTVPVGNYRIKFKPIAGYDTPQELSTEVTLSAPAKVTAIYAPWPACVASDWSCTGFYSCNTQTNTRTRICVLQNPRCSNGDAVQPALSEICNCPPGKQCLTQTVEQKTNQPKR